MIRRVGVFFHPDLAAAGEFAATLIGRIGDAGVEVWSAAADGGTVVDDLIRGTDLLVSVGGDGTMLRAARVVASHPVRILGVKMGRLGFLTELSTDEALDRLPEILDGAGRIEERLMLRIGVDIDGEVQQFDALNDVVVGRGSISRLADLRVMVDGEVLAVFRADGVIVATPTGSTGYVLSAGGPILQPEADALVICSVAPHLSLMHSVVVPGSSAVEVVLDSAESGAVSIDGQVNMTLAAGARITMRRSPHFARFVRLSPPAHFYATLAKKLTRSISENGASGGAA